MENIAKLMYRIARIFALVLLGVAVFLIGLNVVLLIIDAIAARNIADNIGQIIGYVIWAILLLVLIYITTKGIVDLQLNSNDMTPHIIMIVIGLFTADIFYLLGGIFALVAIEERNSK